MKTGYFLTAVFTVVLLAGDLPAAAASGPKARLFAKFDTNQNGIIDGAEVAALRKAFLAEPKGDLARYDTDHDGKLSDDEIAEIKPPGQRGNKKAGKKTYPGASPKTAN